MEHKATSYDRMTPEERREFDAGYDSWKSGLPTLENLPDEEADAELSRLEIQQWAEQMGVVPPSDSVDQLWSDVLQLKQFEASVGADTFRNLLPSDTRSNLYHTFGARLAVEHDLVFPEQTRQLQKTSGLGRGELLQRHAMEYSRGLSSGDYGSVFHELNAMRLESERMSASEFYQWATQQDVMNSKVEYQLNTDLLREFRSLEGEASQLDEQIEADSYMEDTNRRILERENIRPEDGIPAYVSLYDTSSLDELRAKRADLYQSFYEDVSVCDSILSEDLRRELGDGYAAYQKKQMESAQVKQKETSGLSYQSPFDFSKSMSADAEIQKETAKEKTSAKQRVRMADAALDRTEDREEPRSARRLPGGGSFDVPEPEDDWSFGK